MLALSRLTAGRWGARQEVCAEPQGGAGPSAQNRRGRKEGLKGGSEPCQEIRMLLCSNVKPLELENKKPIHDLEKAWQ